MKPIQRSLRILLVSVASLATVSCGFHLRDSYNLPDEIRTLSVTSFDQYGNLQREMMHQLQLHDVQLKQPKEDLANIHLKNENYSENTLSLYQNSRVAEKQFTYSVNYSVTLPDQGTYDFSTSLSRTYLDNPLTALAKSVEEEMLSQEMRIEACKQIIRQLAQLNTHVAKYKEKEAIEAELKKRNATPAQSAKEISIKTRFDGKAENHADSDQKKSKQE